MTPSLRTYFVSRSAYKAFLRRQEAAAELDLDAKLAGLEWESKAEKEKLKECVSRKIPIFRSEHPDWDMDRVVAAAYGYCRDKKRKKAVPTVVQPCSNPVPTQPQPQPRPKAVVVQGIPVVLEVLKGEPYPFKEGSEWRTPIAQHDDGWIPGTRGLDGDPVDVFIGPTLDATHVWVITQLRSDGRIDEHKV